MATVKNNEGITPELVEQLGVVATIHSHNNMGTTPSVTDEQETQTSPTIRFHIITNNSDAYSAIYSEILPCGMFRFAKCKVMIEFEKIDAVRGIEKIKEIQTSWDTDRKGFGTPLYKPPKQANYLNPYGGYGDNWADEEDDDAERIALLKYNKTCRAKKKRKGHADLHI